MLVFADAVCEKAAGAWQGTEYRGCRDGMGGSPRRRRVLRGPTVAISTVCAPSRFWGFWPITLGLVASPAATEASTSFVISGFLIAGIIKSELDAGSFSIAGFYVRRIRRILPALTVCALTTTIFAALVLFPSDFKAFGKSLRGVATSTSNYYFMRQAADYFGGGSAENPTLHTWSLSVEEQFYVVLPLLLLVLFRFGRRGTLPVMGFFAVASLLFSIRGVEFTPQQAFFSTPGRAWELLIGALLAFGAIPHITGRPLREIAAVIGALMIALG